MSALAEALVAAQLEWAWSSSPLDGRVALWIRMDSEPLGLLTMTGEQVARLREALDVRL